MTYLEDVDPEELAAKLEEATNCLGFSEEEARYQDIEAAVRFGSEILAKQGGKLIVVLGNDVEYMPKTESNDNSKRTSFYASDLGFSRIAGDMHKSMAATDLYLFGHKKSKNLGSLGELVRLAGGDLCYYESTSASELTKFYNDLMNNLAKPQTWETVFRIRASQGWKKTSYGNYFGNTFNDLLRIEHVDECAKKKLYDFLQLRA